MDKPTTGEKEPTGEEETPVSEAPTDEPTTPSDETTDSAEKPVETPEATDEPEEAEEVQDESPDRKAFQKMRQEVKRLKGQLEERKHRESVFSTLKPQTPPLTPVDQQLNYNNYVDPQTGAFNQEAYNKDYARIQQEQQAMIAQQNLQQQTYETIDEMRAKDKYPQLDPENESYNAEFERRVAAEWFLQKYMGQRPSLLKIAAEEAKRGSQQAKNLDKQAAQEEGVKEQASLTPQTRSKPGYGNQERLESLRRRTRSGDLDAVVERMKHIKS